jgi:nitrite reductase (NADH) small subunit
MSAAPLTSPPPMTDSATGGQSTSGSRPEVTAREPTWTAVCRLEDLVPERGAAALVAGEQIALFRLRDDEVLAVQQLDPYSGAHVLSRGIVGTRGQRPTVASPMHKQVFDLRTGQCLEPLGAEPRHLRPWPVRVAGRVVMVGRPVVDQNPGEA